MKYKKGTFIVVPNTDSLRGKPTEFLAVFFWLCTYANENGTCFPSRKKLASDCGLSDRTVDKYLAQLVETNLIEKKKRKNKGTNEYTSNLYQILLPQKVAKFVLEPREDEVGTPSEPNIPITIPSINYTNSTIIQPEVVNESTNKKEPFSFIVELEKLRDSSWRPNKILALYMTKKAFTFENQKQMDNEIKINRGVALILNAYKGDRLGRAMDYCEDNFKDVGWNLHTVKKRINTIQ